MRFEALLRAHNDEKNIKPPFILNDTTMTQPLDFAPVCRRARAETTSVCRRRQREPCHNVRHLAAIVDQNVARRNVAMHDGVHVQMIQAQRGVNHATASRSQFRNKRQRRPRINRAPIEHSADHQGVGGVAVQQGVERAARAVLRQTNASRRLSHENNDSYFGDDAKRRITNAIQSLEESHWVSNRQTGVAAHQDVRMRRQRREAFGFVDERGGVGQRRLCPRAPA